MVPQSRCPGNSATLDWIAVRAALRLISGKWDLIILAELESGPRRYNELLRITNLNGKQMARTLRRLQDGGLVDRKVVTESPPVRVTYQLTPHARDLFVLLNGLAQWASRRKWPPGMTMALGSRRAGTSLDMPNAARVYDYLLGGDNNAPAGPEAGDTMTAVTPHARGIARANRVFSRRVLNYLSMQTRIRQFVDIGSGLPKQGSFHDNVLPSLSSARVCMLIAIRLPARAAARWCMAVRASV